MLKPAIRKWKRLIKESGVIDEVKARREYIKPSAIRRKKRDDAMRADWVRRQREH